MASPDAAEQGHRSDSLGTLSRAGDRTSSQGGPQGQTASAASPSFCPGAGTRNPGWEKGLELVPQCHEEKEPSQHQSQPKQSQSHSPFLSHCWFLSRAGPQECLSQQDSALGLVASRICSRSNPQGLYWLMKTLCK